MLDDLLENVVIQLPESKRPEDGRPANPKYCRYHKMVSHPIEKYIKLKKRIM